MAKHPTTGYRYKIIFFPPLINIVIIVCIIAILAIFRRSTRRKFWWIKLLFFLFWLCWPCYGGPKASPFNPFLSLFWALLGTRSRSLLSLGSVSESSSSLNSCSGTLFKFFIIFNNFLFLSSKPISLPKTCSTSYWDCFVSAKFWHFAQNQGLFP